MKKNVEDHSSSISTNFRSICFSNFTEKYEKPTDDVTDIGDKVMTWFSGSGEIETII
jgi:hypothetical protein